MRKGNRKCIMLHILLLILKVLGITLLLVVSILVFLVLLILFSPFRYTFHAEYFDEFKAVARVRWLIFVLDIKGTYEDQTFIYYLKSFGSIISTNDEIEPGFLGKLVQKFHKSKSKSSEKEDTDTCDTGDNLSLHDRPLSDSSNLDDTLRLVEGSDNELPDKNPSSLETTGSPSWFTKVKERGKELMKLPQKIKQQIHDIFHRIKHFFQHTKEEIVLWIKQFRETKAKANDLYKFITHKRTKAAWNSVKHYINLLWRHIKPRKLKGTLHFGFEDPAITGQALGLVSLALPIYKHDITIAPDFEQRIIEGELDGSGRVRLSYIIMLVITVLRDKNLMMVIEKAQTILGGN